MASRKSSVAPNRPTIGALAPSASRYFGKNFFHSSSPSPRRKTAAEAIATLRSRLKKSATRSFHEVSGAATASDSLLDAISKPKSLPHQHKLDTLPGDLALHNSPSLHSSPKAGLARRHIRCR